MKGAITVHEERRDVIVEVLNVRLPFEDKTRAQGTWKVQCTSGKVTNIMPFSWEETDIPVVDVKNDHSGRTVIEGNGGLLLPA